VRGNPNRSSPRKRGRKGRGVGPQELVSRGWDGPGEAGVSGGKAVHRRRPKKLLETTYFMVILLLKTAISGPSKIIDLISTKLS